MIPAPHLYLLPQKNPQIKPDTLYRTGNYKNILDEVNKLQSVSFHVKLSKEFVRIFPDSETAHRNISRYLKENNVQHYLITEYPNRVTKVVLRGLPNDIPVEELKNELINMGYPVIKINQLIKRSNNSPLPYTALFSTNRNLNYSIIAINKHTALITKWIFKWKIALNTLKRV